MNNRIEKIKNSKFFIPLFILALIVISRLAFFIIFAIYAKKNNIAINLANFVDSFTNGSVGMDNGWYNDIVNNGYRDTGEGCRFNWNFFPGFPLLIKGIKLIIPVQNNYIIGFFANTILFGITAYVAYKYVILTRKDKSLGLLVIVMLILGPYSFYTMNFMSESLYMLLLICCFYFLKRKNYIIMGLFGCLLTLTRSTGIFFCFVVLVDYLYNYRKEHDNFKGIFKNILGNSNLILGVALIPIGLFSYMLYLQLKIGDGFGFIHSQYYGWHHDRKYNFIYLIINEMTSDRILLAFIVLICVGLCIKLIINHRFEEALMPLIIFITAHNESFCGLQRYGYSSIFVTIAFCELLRKKPIQKYKWSYYTIIIVLIAFNLVAFDILVTHNSKFYFIYQ